MRFKDKSHKITQWVFTLRVHEPIKSICKAFYIAFSIKFHFLKLKSPDLKLYTSKLYYMRHYITWDPDLLISEGNVGKSSTCNDW